MKHKHIKVHGEYTASSKTDFLFILKQQNINVPSRTEGRTSQHCERFGGFRLLATWANADYLTYPIKLVHRDKPDFFLLHGEIEVGIEFTEAVSEKDAAIDALAEKMGKQAFLFVDMFDFDKRKAKLTESEMKEIIKNPPSGGPGCGDDGFEREWVKWMFARVNKKTNDFNKPEFEKFNKNLLLIYDNSPTFLINIGTAMKYLMPKLDDYWFKNNRFDKVLIETGNQIIQIHPSSWSIQPIFDIWALTESI